MSNDDENSPGLGPFFNMQIFNCFATLSEIYEGF